MECDPGEELWEERADDETQNKDFRSSLNLFPVNEIKAFNSLQFNFFKCLIFFITSFSEGLASGETMKWMSVILH